VSLTVTLKLKLPGTRVETVCHSLGTTRMPEHPRTSSPRCSSKPSLRASFISFPTSNSLRSRSPLKRSLTAQARARTLQAAADKITALLNRCPTFQRDWLRVLQRPSGSSLSLRRSRYWEASAEDAVLSRLPDDVLLQLVVSMERKAHRRAQGLPCLVSKADAKAASKSACKAGELGWLTSSLWLTAFLDSLANDQLLQIIAALVEEVHRRAHDESCTEEDITADTEEDITAEVVQEQLLTLLAVHVPPNTRRFRV